MPENTLLYTGVYSDVSSALADLEDLEHLREAEVIGKYDAAVIDKENGEPHIVKRADYPAIRVIPELLGGGKLPRRELKDAAEELTADEAGLILIGEPTLDKAFDKAVTRAANITKRELDAATDELASELSGAFKPPSDG